MVKTALLILVVGLLALLGALQWSGLPDKPARDTATRDWLKPGPNPVSYFDITLRDDSRVGLAGAVPVAADNPPQTPLQAGERILRTRIWHPDTLGLQRPLVIFSHGLLSNRSSGDYLARFLASHGYLVAAMDFPLTHRGVDGGVKAADVVNQPDDIRFLLDQFLSWNDEVGHQFYHSVDERRVALIGMGLGGLTSLLATFHPTLGDPRVAALVTLATPTYPLAPAFFAQRSLPWLSMASPQDPLVDFDSNAADIRQRAPGAMLLRVEGGSHLGFVSLGRYLRWLTNPDEVVCGDLPGAQNLTGDDQWWRGLVQIGLSDAPPRRTPCQQPLLAAINPVRQQWLVQTAVMAFLESQFALSIDRQHQAQRFFGQQLPEENPELELLR